MICTGSMGKNSLAKETKFVNQDGEEIFYGYRNKFAPLKMIISGCSGKNNYIGETRHLDKGSEFLINKNDDVVLKVTKVPSVIPKCEVIDFHRDLDIKFAIGLGTVKTSIVENDNELAVMTVRRKEYTLEISDNENPTLMVTILMGAAEV